MQFSLKKLLAMITIVCLIIAVAAFVLRPLIRLSSSINAAQRRILNEFDHSSVRDAAAPLLSNAVDGFIKREDWPAVIVETEPNSVYLSNGTISLEYGSGFLHYGLVIDPSNQQPAEYTKVTDGVYFYETE